MKEVEPVDQPNITAGTHRGTAYPEDYGCTSRFIHGREIAGVCNLGEANIQSN